MSLIDGSEKLKGDQVCFRKVTMSFMFHVSIRKSRSLTVAQENYMSMLFGSEKLWGVTRLLGCAIFVRWRNSESREYGEGWKEDAQRGREKIWMFGSE